MAGSAARRAGGRAPNGTVQRTGGYLIDTLGFLAIVRETWAWLSEGKTGSLKIKFQAGQFRGFHREDDLARRQVMGHLEDSLDCPGCGEVCEAVPEGVRCGTCRKTWPFERFFSGAGPATPA